MRFAINSSGTIVGQSDTSSGATHAFRYSGGVMTDLGTLQGDSNSTARAINSDGTIVGLSYTSNDVHAFSYSSGVMTQIGTLPGDSFGVAYGINDGGTSVGGFAPSTSGGNYHAFSYSGGVTTDLGSLLGGSNTVALAINSSGTIVGGGVTTIGHAFSYSGGEVTDLSQYLSSIGIAGNSQAIAINDNGDIVGYGTISAPNTPYHAFLLRGVRTKPHAATALAVVTNGFFVGANLTDGGYGYTNIPTVRIIGGGGTGAQAVAVVSNKMVIGVNVRNAGFGYTNAPLIIIEPPFIPNPVLGIAPLSFLSFSNLTIGGVYQLQQLVIYYWSNQPLSFTATNSIYTQMFAGFVGSNNYRLALSPVPNQAFATPEVVNGIVVGATVTSGGSGYVTIPTVNIVAHGGGSNATAVAQISGGMVTNISIISAGIGYTNTPTVAIDPPPAAAVYPTTLPVMRIDASSLAPYDNYQLQFKPSIGAAWGNWNGGLFSPTGATNSQYLFITNGTGFFRLVYMP